MTRQLTPLIFAAFALPMLPQIDYEYTLNREEPDKYLNNILTDNQNILINMPSVDYYAIRN